MILVDIGNSGLRAARVADHCLFSEQRVYRLSWSAAVASQRKPSPEQEAAPDQRWCELKDDSAFEWLVSKFAGHRDELWSISCVQHLALQQLRKSLDASGVTRPPQIVVHSELPMKIAVDQPSKTGIDRLLASFAAFQLRQSKQPLIVVQAGTAVTVDLVDEFGVFQGGAIMPGLGLSLQLLAAGTEQLPWLGNHAVDTSPEIPGKNTAQAISAGVNAALVGGVVHLVSRYRHERSKMLEVCVSGGDGGLLLPYIAQPATFIDHLVLRGLSLLHRSSV